MARFDPQRRDFAPYGLTATWWTPTLTRRSDRHNEIELNLMLGGSITYLLGGRRLSLRPGRLHAFWAAIPHQIIGVGDGADYLVATIPLADFMRFGLPGDLARSILQGQLVCDGRQGDNAADRQLFTRWIDDLRGDPAASARIVLLEMEARLARMAMSLEGGARAARAGQVPAQGRMGARAPGDAGLGKVGEMAAHIARHHAGPLSVQDIADQVGLHPHYAMTLFRQAIGATLIDYVTQHRISHAQRLLLTTDQRVMDVALAAGFNTLSRFNDAFKRACGCTPREYRRGQRAAPG